MSEFGVSRRNLICGVAAGAAVPFLAACGGTESAGPSGTTSTVPGAPAGSAPAGGSSAAAGSITTSEIPVGGGKIFPDREIVVTQPTAGEFKAFSAKCTHVGTTLDEIQGTSMICPNHGSRFAITDGSVEQGPASAPLPELTVTVTGDTLEVSG